MTKLRVTVTIDEETGKKLRTLQASLITSSITGWGFSGIVSLVLEEVQAIILTGNRQQGDKFQSLYHNVPVMGKLFSIDVLVNKINSMTKV